VERAREGVFNHLRDLVDGATVWDIYAGSGILGLEALSRGAAQVIAVEFNRKAILQIKENVKLIGCAKQLKAMQIDAYRVPQLASSLAAPTLIFFDPPYADFRDGGPGRQKVWQLFVDLCASLEPGGAAIVHTPRGILNDDELDKLPHIERRDYGTASLYWWHNNE